MATISQPIWKDCVVTLLSSLSPTNAGMDFRIQLVKRDNSKETIYTGRCYQAPGSNRWDVKINDICADYLERALPLDGKYDYQDATFNVDNWAISDWHTVATVTFYRDWSYDQSHNPATASPLDPITPYVHGGGYLPLFSRNGVFSAHIGGGDFNNDFNLDFSAADWYIENVSNGVTYFLDLSQYPGAKTVEANGRTYKVADLCGGWCLYYINAYGGWDCLPVQGRTVRKASLTRYNVDKDYNNGNYANRGRETYAEEIEGQFTFNIGPLTTAESEKIHHLLGSTYVYAHDIAANRIHAIVLTGNAYEIEDSTGKLHTYQVEASLAQGRTRR